MPARLQADKKLRRSRVTGRFLCGWSVFSTTIEDAGAAIVVNQVVRRSVEMAASGQWESATRSPPVMATSRVVSPGLIA